MRLPRFDMRVLSSSLSSVSREARKVRKLRMLALAMRSRRLGKERTERTGDLVKRVSYPVRIEMTSELIEVLHWTPGRRLSVLDKLMDDALSTLDVAIYELVNTMGKTTYGQVATYARDGAELTFGKFRWDLAWKDEKYHLDEQWAMEAVVPHPHFSWWTTASIVGTLLPNMRVSHGEALPLRDFISENIFSVAANEFEDLLVEMYNDRRFDYGGMTERETEDAYDYQDTVAEISPDLELTFVPP